MRHGQEKLPCKKNSEQILMKTALWGLHSFCVALNFTKIPKSMCTSHTTLWMSRSEGVCLQGQVQNHDITLGINLILLIFDYSIFPIEIQKVSD